MALLIKSGGLRQRHDTAVRLALFYAAVFLIVGVYASFLPLWFSASGLSETQIAIVYAVPVMLRPVFTMALSYLADRSGQHVRLLKILAWGALASILILPFSQGFLAIFAAFTLFAMFWFTVVPLTEAVAVRAAADGLADYGRVRLWGSLSYIGVVLAGGAAVDVFGPPAALWMFVGSAASVVLASYFLPDRPRPALAPSESAPVIRLADLQAFARLPAMWLFLAAGSAVQATHAVYYIFGTIHWTAIGIAPSVIGGLWAIGVIAEIALFAYAARLAQWVGPVQLILTGAVAGLLRWSLTSLDPPLAALFALQLLHALTFGAAHLGAMQFIARAFPAHVAATAQGLYASFSAGLGMGIAYLAAGPLYRAFGAGAYLGMAAISVGAIVAALLLMRLWSGGALFSTPERG